MHTIPPEAEAAMKERFGHDSLLALATVENGLPWVRTVNAYYENGSFYIITHGLSNKMRQLRTDPHASMCGDWFTCHGLAIDLGAYKETSNARMAEILRKVFASWIDNGHNNLEDEQCRILQIQLTDAVLFCHGTRYDLVYEA